MKVVMGKRLSMTIYDKKARKITLCGGRMSDEFGREKIVEVVSIKHI